MKNPMWYDSAAWCEIRCLKEGVGVEVAAHSSFFEAWNNFTLPKGSPEKLSWPPGSIVKGEWVSWEFRYPRNIFGKGREKAWQMRERLLTLFHCINGAVAFGCESSAKSPQLLFIEYFLVLRQQKGGGFTVIICPSLGAWIAGQTGDGCGRSSEEVTKKMMVAGKHMAGKENWGWGASISQDNRILLSGGFGTVLGTSLQDSMKGRLGQRLTSDNIDGSYDQLVLLYAVAALHDLAREDGAI